MHACGMSMIKRYDDVIIASFEHPKDARVAVEILRDLGIGPNRIGILTRDEHGDPELETLRERSGSKSGEGAAVGATAGAGGGALWALGIAAGVLPAIGPVIAGGLLAAVVASAATGAAAGTVVGALTGLGVDDEGAAFYEREFRRGNTVLVVQTGEHTVEALQVLRRVAPAPEPSPVSVPPEA